MTHRLDICLLWSTGMSTCVLVKDTVHTMYTTETLLAFPHVVPETGPVELHQGHWLKSMLTPCCHKQNTVS